MSGLYPLKFSPILKERVWGGDALHNKLNKQSPEGMKVGESWEISGLQGDISVISNGYLAGNNLEEICEVYMGDLLGDSVYEKFGKEFPLLIKLIDTQDVLSMQVHPDDDISLKRHNAYGKTEMWYILEAKEESKIYAGFKNQFDWDKLNRAIENNEICSYLNCIEPSTGDVFYIPSGRIHTIGGGILLVEIQQTSDITYRIHDWNRVGLDGKPRVLHRDLAEEAIDYSRSEDHFRKIEPTDNKAVELLTCPYFTTNIISFNSLIERDYSNLDSFVFYLCVDGNLEIEWDSETIELIKGETVLIPSMVENINLTSSGASLLEVYIENDNQKEE